MFSDHTSAATEFRSSWRQTRSVKEGGCQTERQETKEVAAQSTLHDEAGTQTEELMANEGSRVDVTKQLNAPSLIKFLSHAAPLIEYELAAAARSRAFDGYALIHDEGERQVSKVHTLVDGTNGYDNGTGNEESSLGVSAVTWNSAGSVVAVAYAHAEHEDWCDHSTSLAVWNINRRDFDPSKPHQTMPTASTCLTAAEFHKTDPTLVLAGGFTGELYLWSVARDQDPLVATSNMKGHREKVTGVEWVTATQVLSCALDGRVILWNVDAVAQNFLPARIYLLKAEHLPRSLKVRGRSSAEVGITCMALNSEDKDIFIMGTEPGTIFQGSLMSQLPAAPPDDYGMNLDADDGTVAEFRDPVSVVFGGHGGRVVDIRCSPFHRDIFASAGSDHEIRVYSLLYPQAPTHVIHLEEAPSSVVWSPARPLVIVAATQTPSLHLLDLLPGGNAGIRLRAAERQERGLALTSAAFNNRGNSGGGRGMLSAGDSFGRLHVWHLTELHTSSSGPGEVRLLDAFLGLENSGGTQGDGDDEGGSGGEDEE